MKTLLGAIFFMASGLASLDVVAQSVRWSDIDCSKSRLVAPSDAKCMNTNVTGGDSQTGQYQRWSLTGSQQYLYVRLDEALDAGSVIFVKQTGEQYLRGISGKTKDAGDWAGPHKHGGADYYLFKAKDGEECIGFRGYGPSRSTGYGWVMGGVSCLPKGTSLTTTWIAEFIDSMRVK